MPKEEFEKVLKGSNYQVIKLSHPWLNVLVQNADGHAALLIRASLADDQIVGDGRGYEVKTERNGEDNYVRLVAHDTGLPPVFLKLVEYVLQRTRDAGSEEASILAMIEAIDEFKKFGARRSGRLSEDEVRGLVAELVLLRLLIESGAPTEAVISAWRGPLSQKGLGMHDFTFPDGRAIEVKSTHQPPIEIRVASPDQLRPTKNPLDLVVLPLEQVTVGTYPGLSFRDYVSETGDRLNRASPFCAEKWQDALDALQLDLSDEYYYQYWFLTGYWLRYSVQEGFPEISPDSLPVGIVKVTYSLELQRLSIFSRSFPELISLGIGPV